MATIKKQRENLVHEDYGTITKNHKWLSILNELKATPAMGRASTKHANKTASCDEPNALISFTTKQNLQWFFHFFYTHEIPLIPMKRKVHLSNRLQQ